MPNQTRLKTWNSGETLTAADLNNEFDRALAGYNDNALDGDNLSTTATYVFGEVVIGTTITSADGGQLHIHSGSAGSISAAADFDEAVFENSTAAGITILSGNTSTGGIAFGDDGDADNGRLLYAHGASPTFQTFIDGTSRTTLTTTALSPTTTDAMSLGTTSLNWSDLFLDSGAVINFDSGDITITHSANTLTFAGGTAVGFGPTISNDGDNRVVTLDGSGGLNGEASLTFDGNLLGVNETANANMTIGLTINQGRTTMKRLPLSPLMLRMG